MSKDPKTDATLLDWLKISDRPNWKRAKPLGALLGALISIGVPLLILSAFAGAFVVVYGTINDVFDPASNGPNLGAGALIAALLGAPFLIWGTIIKQRTWETQKEGHITDRISKAVEQLGAEKTVKKLTENGQTVETTEPNIEVRIGGLLSLERIAQDSTAYDKGRDHVRVMEILCAYVRENAKAEHLAPTPNLAAAKTPRIDVQTAMNVIKRRGADQVAIEAAQKYRLDLRGCDFDGFDLSRGNFAGAMMSDCRFEAANLTLTDMTGTRMWRSLLDFTRFQGAVMHGTQMEFCERTTSNWDGMTSAQISSVFIEGANMSSLFIREANYDAFFGSRDTEISSAQMPAKTEGLEIAGTLLLKHGHGGEGFNLDEARKAASPKARMFVHWNPFEQRDRAAAALRQTYRERKGLTGWPHED